VYTWFGDEEHLLFTTEQIDDFYKAANGLIYANEHNETRFNGSFIESTRLLSIEWRDAKLLLKKRLNNLKGSKSGTISGNDFMVVSNSMELP
jgi:hypothetical protein